MDLSANVILKFVSLINSFLSLLGNYILFLDFFLYFNNRIVSLKLYSQLL